MQTDTSSKTQVSRPVRHHYVRTFFASLFGVLATSLILISILVIWVNHTLTDTATYTKTVAPLVTKTEVQNFVANKVSSKIVESAPAQDIAEKILDAKDIQGKTPDQLLSAVQPVIHRTVVQVLASRQFASTWESTNRSAHQQLVSQLKSGSPALSIDLSPIVASVVDELKNTQLAAIADKIDLKPGDAKIDLAGSGIDKAHEYYKWSQDAVVGIVAVTVLFTVLAIVTSVHHNKTLRRILLGTGVMALLITIAIQVPSFIQPSGPDSDAQAAGLVVAKELLKDLQITTGIIALLCFVAVVVSKVYSVRHAAVAK